jgi:hypothetical protein
MRAKRVIGCAGIVVALALLLPAAAALAQVPNANFKITDLSEPDTTATVNHTGASNSGTGQTICRNGTSTVTVSVATTHPESVRLAKNTATMSQGTLGNFPAVRVVGAGAQVFNVVLACDSASFKSYINAEPFKNFGSFQVQGVNCTGLTEARANYLRDTCAIDVNNTTIQLTTDGAVVEKVSIKVKKGSTAL